ALVALPSLVALGVNAAIGGFSPLVLTGIFLGLGGLAYGTALGGLARARRGDSPEWRWLPRRSGIPGDALATEDTGSTERDFESEILSPERAQIWFEWRSMGLGLPLVLAAVCLLMSLPLLWVRDMAPLGVSPAGPGFGSIE